MQFAIVRNKESGLFGKRVMLGHKFSAGLYDLFTPYGMLLQRGVTEYDLALL